MLAVNAPCMQACSYPYCPYMMGQFDRAGYGQYDYANAGMYDDSYVPDSYPEESEEGKEGAEDNMYRRPPFGPRPPYFGPRPPFYPPRPFFPPRPFYPVPPPFYPVPPVYYPRPLGGTLPFLTGLALGGFLF